MKVKYLIEQLKKFNQEYEVCLSVLDGDDLIHENVCYSVDEGFINSDGIVFILEHYEPEDGEDTSDRVVVIS